jgi:hypothetical protein
MMRLFAFLLLTTSVAYAQVAEKETFTVTFDSTNQGYRPVTDSKSVLKAGVGLPLFRHSSVSSTWKTIGLDATYEYKIGNAISLLGSLEMNYGFGMRAWLYTIELPIGMRYYFSIGKKMKNRINTNSMFRYYVSLRTENALFSNLYYDDNPYNEKYYRGTFVSYRTNVSKYNEAFNLMQYAYFQLGSQFKIKTTNYLDVNVIIPVSALIYHKQEFTLADPALISIKYGLFWSK